MAKGVWEGPVPSQITLHQDSVSDRDVVCVLCVPVLSASCSSAHHREHHRAKEGCVAVV